MTFRCFGTRCAVLVDDRAAAALARRRLEAWHDRFSRFRPDSELSRLNADPRPAVPVSPVMARLVAAVVAAARLTDGLVDSTLLREIEAAGYRTDLGAPLSLPLALRLAPRRAPARPHSGSRWREIRVRGGVVHRPPGLAIDSGGLAKGLFADLIAESLPHAALAVDCGGDVRFRGPERRIHVADPFGGPPRHAFALRAGAAATSGIARRSWLDADGRPAHHLLDPATGRPAYTGVVQATALAPTALEAEVRAKAALLAGPDAAPAWLPHGGVLVLDDGRQVILEEDAEPDHRTTTAAAPAGTVAPCDSPASSSPPSWRPASRRPRPRPTRSSMSSRATST
jgi:thiamine biosynthesis lipoprotein